MKKIILFSAVFFLSGCPGSRDGMVPRESALVTLRNNLICIVSPMDSAEKITAVQIYDSKGSRLIKMFDDRPLSVKRGECLPTFGFSFQPGSNYAIAWDIKSDQTAHHLIAVEFTTTANANGGLRVSEPTNSDENSAAK